MTMVQPIESKDGTKKFLIHLEDAVPASHQGATTASTSHQGVTKVPTSHQSVTKTTVECVLLPKNLKARKNLKEWNSTEKEQEGSYSICLSSQVGCAMKCDFCLTGKYGLKRNLTADEILLQLQTAEDYLKKTQPESRITSIVFMGMGEPLHNIDHVTDAIGKLLHRSYMPFSRRKIMVSTSGLLPGMKKLSDSHRPRLAVSLNATTDALREQIMPVNKKYKIAELLEASKEYAVKSKMRVVLEYILFQGLNDTGLDLKRLIEIAKGPYFQVNLIPFNPWVTDTYGVSKELFMRPDSTQVKAFQHGLITGGVRATVRYSGGEDVLAACGQLAVGGK